MNKLLGWFQLQDISCQHIGMIQPNTVLQWTNWTFYRHKAFSIQIPMNMHVLHESALKENQVMEIWTNELR